MAVTQRQYMINLDASQITIADSVAFALTHLHPDEATAVQQIIRELPSMSLAAPRDPRLRRLVEMDDVYIVRATPEIRLFVRIVPGGIPEVLDMVMAETLVRSFGVADPFQVSP